MAKKNSTRERAKKVPEHIKTFVEAVMKKGSTNFGEWQICPKCNGHGAVSKPPYLAGDITQWSSTSMSHVCDVCKGAKIIQKPIIKQ